jgi:hypothetical protein
MGGIKAMKQSLMCLVAHPVTLENLGLLVWVGIGIAIGIGFCTVSNCRYR